MQRQRSFTLLEIMVVIVILGILASRWCQLNGQQRKSGSPEGGQRSGGAGGALDMYKLDNSRYPIASRVSRRWSAGLAPSRRRVTTRRAAISAVCLRIRGATTISCSAPASTVRSTCLALALTGCRIPMTILATGISGKNSATARLHVTGNDAHFAVDGRQRGHGDAGVSDITRG